MFRYVIKDYYELISTICLVIIFYFTIYSLMFSLAFAMISEASNVLSGDKENRNQLNI